MTKDQKGTIGIYVVLGFLIIAMVVATKPSAHEEPMVNRDAESCYKQGYAQAMGWSVTVPMGMDGKELRCGH